MSKRLGNVRTLDAVAELGLAPLDFRYFCCSAQYRQPMTFSPDDLQAKAREREGLLQLRRRLREATGTKPGPASAAAAATRAAFDAAMDDDLNVAGALGALNTLRAEVNRLLDGGSCSAKDASAVEAVFGWADQHLACLALPDEPPLGAAEAAQVAAREAARARRDFAEADRLRDALLAAGIRVEDTPAGPRWRRTRA
jgi:cysteinyl-tRNA synthetase